MSRWEQSAWTKDDLVGGHPVLDFLNTAGGLTKARDVERLIDFAVFLKWTVVAKVLTPQDAADLQRQAQASPKAANSALFELLSFREALHACLVAEQANQNWPEESSSRVVRCVSDALREAYLEKRGISYEWSACKNYADLSFPLMKLALSTETLLRSDDLARMRNCDRCSWLFIDRGRGRARRWCSMAACGSRAKSARYYERQKAAPS